ncbi:MAG: hypothetical protein KKD44_27095 [Proteobacteria bacterium]|nr:hypothetical protein [Pseudomonadota bacterium]
MKKILELNHKLVQHFTNMIFPIGCVFIMVFGALVTASQNPTFTLDLSAYPKGLGYLMVYGGLLLLLSFTIDVVIALIVSGFVKHVRQLTLQERVEATMEGLVTKDASNN